MFSELVGQRYCFCFDFIFFLFFFYNTRAVFGKLIDRMDITLCFIFFFFLTMEARGLNVTSLWHHRQLPRSMRAKPHLPDARFMPIRTASICVYACVYIDIYIKREKYLWIYFFPILWRELLIRNKQKRSLFFGGTLPCYSEGKCLFSWK